MKLSSIRRIAREDLVDAPDWVDSLLQPLNSAIEQLTQAVSGQLELANNMFVEIVTQKFTHDVELVIKNPFSGNNVRPIGILPLATEGTDLIGAYNMVIKSTGELGIKIKFDPGAVGYKANVKICIFGG